MSKRKGRDFKTELHKQDHFWRNGIINIFLFVIASLLFREGNSYLSYLYYSNLDLPMLKEHQFGKLSISYPLNWVLSPTPYGNHGDTDVAGILSIPFQSLPEITIAERSFPSNDLALVNKWSAERLSFKTEAAETFPTAFELNNITGTTKTYTFRSNGISSDLITCKDIYLNESGSGYAISFCSDTSEWQQYSILFEKIINDINLIP